MTRPLIVLTLLLQPLLAGAAAPLGILQWPVAGRPAVVTPGGTFDVGMKGEGSLELIGTDQSHTLDPAWDETRGAVRHGRVTLPDSVAPGNYALSSGGETRANAVHVVPAMPEDYTIAIVRRGPVVEGGSPQLLLSGELPARLDKAGVELVFVVGPLTESGSAADLEAVRQAVEAMPRPVFVVPADVDMQAGAWESTFGPLVHALVYGSDGYLFLGPDLAADNAAVPQRLGPIYRLRREIRASRWSVGVTGRYGLDWDVRGQMALFVDDPLDYLLAGKVGAGLTGAVPWGKARFLPPADVPASPLLILEVNTREITLRLEPAAAGE